MKSIILSSTLLKTLNPPAIAGMPPLCRLATVSCCWKLIAQWIICQSYTMLQSTFITLLCLFSSSLHISLTPLCIHLHPSVTMFTLWDRLGTEARDVSSRHRKFLEQRGQGGMTTVIRNKTERQRKSEFPPKINDKYLMAPEGAIKPGAFSGTGCRLGVCYSMSSRSCCCWTCKFTINFQKVPTPAANTDNCKTGLAQEPSGTEKKKEVGFYSLCFFHPPPVLPGHIRSLDIVCVWKQFPGCQVCTSDTQAGSISHQATHESLLPPRSQCPHSSAEIFYCGSGSHTWASPFQSDPDSSADITALMVVLVLEIIKALMKLDLKKDKIAQRKQTLPFQCQHWNAIQRRVAHARKKIMTTG